MAEKYEFYSYWLARYCVVYERNSSSLYVTAATQSLAPALEISGFCCFFAVCLFYRIITNLLEEIVTTNRNQGNPPMKLNKRKNGKH